MAAHNLTIEGIKSFVGQELGVSDWHVVTQPDVDAFAGVTRDRQWIHVDPERAAKESPFGGPIAHGYFTVALAPFLLGQIWRVHDSPLQVNYGLNKLRFPTPVPVGARVRARATLASAEDIAGGLQAVFNVVFELDGHAKPACVMEPIYRYYT